MVKNRTPSRKLALCLAMVIGITCALAARPVPAMEWDPDSFRGESTLDFLTVGPEEGEHWSRVWLVLIDHQLYVRLGSRAAGRIEQNTTTPFVKVRIAGQQFDRVKVEPAPDMKDAVAAEMANKYWTDLMMRHFDHPLTARLIAEPPPHSP